MQSKLKQLKGRYWRLVLIIGLGALLRFWQLDLKPLWLDEVITALFSLGQTYQSIPQDTFFPLTALDQVFVFQPSVTCANIAQAVATESVHPPLFFCLMYRWLSWLRPDAAHLVWTLRALPALFGVGAIAALYALNRVIFSPKAAALGAALMAVSPFAVYLSQEARHYTLPMLLITLALLGLVQVQQDLIHQRWRFWVWGYWIGVNALSLYVHYFCLLALVAQGVALGVWMLWQRDRLQLRQWLVVGVSFTSIGVLYLPWMPTVISHFSRPETDWLTNPNPTWLDRLAPLYQMILGWVVMVVALPIEGQPLVIALLMGTIMLLFFLWLARQVMRGLKQWRSPVPPGLWLLIGFLLTVWLQFLAIAYLLNKDITIAPRYNFVYYPGFCAVLGASLAALPPHPLLQSPFPKLPLTRFKLTARQVQAIALLIGCCSSLFVVHNLAFQKSYSPDRVAQHLAFEPTQPLAVVMGYSSPQDIALGMSFALALRQLEPPAGQIPQVAFLHQQPSYQQVWQALQQLPHPLTAPLNLWIIAPGLRARDYPEQLPLAQPQTGTARCDRDPEQYYRIGIPYQLYRCRSAIAPNL